MEWQLGLPNIMTFKWGGVCDWRYDPCAFHNNPNSDEFWQENIIAYCEFPEAYKGSSNEDES